MDRGRNHSHASSRTDISPPTSPSPNSYSATPYQFRTSNEKAQPVQIPAPKYQSTLPPATAVDASPSPSPTLFNEPRSGLTTYEKQNRILLFVIAFLLIVIMGLLIALLVVGLRAWHFISGSYAMDLLQPRNLSQMLSSVQQTLMENLTKQLAPLQQDISDFNAQMAGLKSAVDAIKGNLTLPVLGG